MQTGPKTTEGKAISSRNAYKHGVYSNQLRLRPEEESDFAVFRAGLATDLKPDGALQAEIFTRILRVLWTLRRLDKREDDIYCETGLPLNAVHPKEFENSLRYRRHLAKEERELMAQLSELQTEAALRTLGTDYEALNAYSVLVTAKKLIIVHNLRCASPNEGKPKLVYSRAKEQDPKLTASEISRVLALKE